MPSTKSFSIGSNDLSALIIPSVEPGSNLVDHPIDIVAVGYLEMQVDKK